MRKFLVLCSVLFVSACTTANFNQNQSLKPNEGLLLSKCDSHGHMALYIYKADYVPNKFAPGIGLKASLDCSRDNSTANDVILVALDAGEYIIANSGFSASAPRFKIKANKINYIGNFGEGASTYVRYGAFNQNVVRTRQIGFSDDLDVTREKLFEQYPDFSQRYEIVTSLALEPK